MPSKIPLQSLRKHFQSQRIRAILRELQIFLFYLIRKWLFRRHKGIVIFPCQPLYIGGSSLLWGPLLGSELKEYGWNIVVIPSHLSLRQRKQLIRWTKPRAILMIKGRNPYNYPSLYSPIPTVFILDDADYVKEQLRDQVIECCKQSKAIIAGNETVKLWCKQYNANVSVIWVPHPRREHPVARENYQRRQIIAWAHSSPRNYPIEVKFIHSTIKQLNKLTQNFEFWFYGINTETDLHEFLSPLIHQGVNVKGIPFALSYDEYIGSLENVAIGLHPVCLENPFSHGKSFGKILSYIYSDVAVVTHDVLDHTKFFKHRVNGMLSNDPYGYAQCIYELIANPTLRQSIVNQAKKDFNQHLTTSVAAKKINLVLQSIP